MRAVFSLGHSTRELEELVELLQHHGVVQLMDVRSYPASRRHPHFGRAALEVSLPPRGIAYRWMPGLGGRRRPAPRSVNTGWRVEGFRAYADYMQTPEFATALSELEEWAETEATAFMCAEAYFRRCHRQLISDALVSRGWQVLHLTSTAAPAAHELTSFARVLPDGHLEYRGEPELPLLPDFDRDAS